MRRQARRWSDRGFTAAGVEPVKKRGWPLVFRPTPLLCDFYKQLKRLLNTPKPLDLLKLFWRELTWNRAHRYLLALNLTADALNDLRV